MKNKESLSEKEKDFYLVSHEGDNGFLTKDVSEAIKEAREKLKWDFKLNEDYYFNKEREKEWLVKEICLFIDKTFKEVFGDLGE